jgi:radical SAM protein with 4Fe4S-binding SPASM domain
MINISKLWCGTPGSMDHLRYSNTSHHKPVVVWNTTRQCNLHCVHCYSKSENKHYSNELTTDQAKNFVKDIADFGVPVLLFSGGEPLLRKDIFEIAQLASDSGIRPVLSTNGTLITETTAQKLKKAGFSYVGVSLDGIGKTNDKFRGAEGAFDLAIKGIRNCFKAEVKPGLRFTVTKHNYKDVPEIFNFIETEKIPRVCFYHLAYVGRAADIAKDDLTCEQTRTFMDYILTKTEDLHKKGQFTEVLTVDNHADGAYLYIKLKEKNPAKAEEVLKLLKLSKGNSSGAGIGSVDFNGNVHPDQFWQHYSLGNILEQPFSKIWTNNSEPLLKSLRERKKLLKGKCSQCQYIDICNGNLRVRAEATYNDLWAPDPACYLTNQEINCT